MVPISLNHFDFKNLISAKEILRFFLEKIKIAFG